jgi:N-acetylglucosaminyldiphosphoundecaprenol N-acetyl-beta-D-mannosaminyltransferase
MTGAVTVERVNVLGVAISAINRQRAHELLIAAIHEGLRGYVCVTGVHGVMESQRDEHLRLIHNRALLCTPDGMPMVWMGRLQGHRQIGRVYGPDLMLDVCSSSVRHGLRHYFFGGAPGVAEELKRTLEQRFPGLIVAGTCSPPFRPLNDREEAELIAQVDAVRPDIFWVGLSTPKQERFMGDCWTRLHVPLMIGVGAAFDFHTGRVRQAPRWMQATGLEWFYRLCQEPRRLWRRYLTNNPRFVVLAIGQLLGLKRYSLD